MIVERHVKELRPLSILQLMPPLWIQVNENGYLGLVPMNPVHSAYP